MFIRREVEDWRFLGDNEGTRRHDAEYGKVVESTNVSYKDIVDFFVTVYACLS